MAREKRWQYPERDAPRGRLSQREEADILATPRPAESVVNAEREKFLRDHPQTPDTARHPHDRIPTKLHESRQVDDLGTPAMAEAFLRYLSGEHAKSPHDRQVELVLMEVQRTNRPLWTLLEEHFFYKRSFREIAAQMCISEKTVRRVVGGGILDVQSRVVELFGTNA